MRLLLPMAYTIAFVMNSATKTDSKSLNPNDNYTYRLLEVDLQPPAESEEETTQQSHKVRPSNDNYQDNSYQQSIIPRRAQPSYTTHRNDYDDEDDDNAGDNGTSETVKPSVIKSNGKRGMINGKKIVNVEIPDDFQREISQLRIPRRVTKKKKRKKKKSLPTKDPLQDVDMDMDMEMDVNVDMDVNVGEEESGRNEENDDNANTEKPKKVVKRRKSSKSKIKGKGKSKASPKVKAASKERPSGNENKGQEGGGDDDDESNHQEEEEEVEEKKEKVHKLTIKKRRPYVNGTKPISTSASASSSPSGAKQGTPIMHTHSHSYPPNFYQQILGGLAKKPSGWNKPNTQSTSGGIKHLQNLQKQPQLQTPQPPTPQKQKQQQQTATKLVKPLMLQENPAVEVLNANHQETGGSGGVRKGIKPRDVNLILRTKNSPRILIRRYKPLFGAYPVGFNLVTAGRGRKILLHRPHKGSRKKSCKKCKKKRNRHKLYSQNPFSIPGLVSDDVETLHQADLGNFNAAAATPTSCTHTNSLSPLQQIGGFSGPTYSWYGNDDGASASIGNPSSYFPNKFEYADENVISPRLPSQQANAFIRVPLPSPSPAFGSGRSGPGSSDTDGGNNNNNNVLYETLPSDANANSAIATAATRQQQENEGGKPRRRQKQRQRSDDEKTPEYQVTESEYEPVTGHANVEELAAVHQRETDATLFTDEHDKHHPHQKLQLQLEPYTEVEGNGEAEDPFKMEDDEQDAEEEQNEQQQSYQQDDEPAEDDGQAGQEEEEESGADAGLGEEQNQQYVDEENENPQSDKIFDMSNADAWSEDINEIES